MKIVFISPNGLRRNANYQSEEQVGAIEKQMLGLALVMSNDHEVYIIRPWNDKPNIETFKGIHLINISVYSWQDDFNYRYSFSQAPFTLIMDLIYSLKVRRKIEQIKPDIVNIPTHTIAYFLSSIGYPKVFTTHTHVWSNRDNLISKVEQRMLKKFKNNGGIIVPLNNKIKQDLNNVGLETHDTIPNAIEIHEYKKGIDKGYVLYSGRLLPHKGIRYLIDAFSRIENDFETKLLIVGSGPERNKLEELARKLGVKKIEFKFFLPRSKFLEYISNCSIFVLPSVDEMFGVVVLEAMACSKPVIASDIPGPRDVITHGKDGFLFERGNASELKEYWLFAHFGEKLYYCLLYTSPSPRD